MSPWPTESLGVHDGRRAVVEARDLGLGVIEPQGQVEAAFGLAGNKVLLARVAGLAERTPPWALDTPPAPSGACAPHPIGASSTLDTPHLGNAGSQGLARLGAVGEAM